MSTFKSTICDVFFSVIFRKYSWFIYHRHWTRRNFQSFHQIVLQISYVFRIKMTAIDKIQVLDSIEKELLLCLQSAGKKRALNPVHFPTVNLLFCAHLFQAKLCWSSARRKPVKRQRKPTRTSSWNRWTLSNRNCRNRSTTSLKCPRGNPMRGPDMLLQKFCRWHGIVFSMWSHASRNWKSARSNTSRLPIGFKRNEPDPIPVLEVLCKGQTFRLS